MGSLLKIISVLAAGRQIVDSKLFQRYVGQIVFAITVTVIFALFLGALFICGLFIIYRALILYADMTSVGAAGILLLALVAITALAGFGVRRSIRNIGAMPRMVQYIQSPVQTKIEDVIDAFVSGVKTSGDRSQIRNETRSPR